MPSPAGSGSQFSVGDGNRFCGRWMGLAPPSTSAPSFTYSASNAGNTVCTRQVPYRMRVHFRSDQTARDDNLKDKIVIFLFLSAAVTVRFFRRQLRTFVGRRGRPRGRRTRRTNAPGSGCMATGPAPWASSSPGGRRRVNISFHRLFFKSPDQQTSAKKIIYVILCYLLLV